MLFFFRFFANFGFQLRCEIRGCTNFFFVVICVGRRENATNIPIEVTKIRMSQKKVCVPDFAALSLAHGGTFIKLIENIKSYRNIIIIFFFYFCT